MMKMVNLQQKTKFGAQKITGLVVVPAHNEEESLPSVIRELQHCIPLQNLLFIDDASSDRTAAILADAQVPFLSHPVNLGYKQALLTAMHYGLSKNYPYFVFFDADGQHRTVDLLALIRTFEEGGGRLRHRQSLSHGKRLRLGSPAPG